MGCVSGVELELPTMLILEAVQLTVLSNELCNTFKLFT